MACETKTLKVFALILDVIYAILGVVVIGIGFDVLFEFAQFRTAAFVILGFGFVVLLAAVFGFIGAVRESSMLSKAFVVYLIILIILQVVVVSFFWIFQNSVLINADKTFDDLWREQPVPINPENGSNIASLEKWLSCCGNKGPDDYMQQPPSCYNSNGKMNLVGCRQKFLDYIYECWTGLNIFAICLVVVEVICAIFAYVLANSIVNRWRRSKYYAK